MPDLLEAIDDLERRLGVAAVVGGQHIGIGTWNALVSLGGGTYLELLAPDPAQPGQLRPGVWGLDRLEVPRLITWAADGSPLDERVARARAAGVELSVQSMSRERPDGTTMTWRVACVADDETSDGLVPFLIDWGDSVHPTATLPEGAVLTSLRGRHPDPARVRSTLEALGTTLDLAPSPATGLVAEISGPSGSIMIGD